MPLSKTTKSIFKQEDSSESDSGSEDELVKKLYEKVKRDLQLAAKPEKKKREFKSEESKSKMAEILRAGREKAKAKREAIKAQKTEIADEYLKKSKPIEIPKKQTTETSQKKEEKIEPAQPAQPVQPAQPAQPVQAQKPEPIQQPIKPQRIIMMNGTNMSKFWYN
jgi:hypothetical protein